MVDMKVRAFTKEEKVLFEAYTEETCSLAMRYKGSKNINPANAWDAIRSFTIFLLSIAIFVVALNLYRKNNQKL